MKTRIEQSQWNDPKEHHLDISFAREKLDSEPTVPLHQRLIRTLKYFRKVIAEAS